MDCARRPKAAFYAYRVACEPLMISLRCNRDRFFSGEKMSVEIWVCNYTHEILVGQRLSWCLRENR